MIDCFFIGHNEIPFEQYEKNIKIMGSQSGAYRDLTLNFIMYNNKPYSASDIFNIFKGYKNCSQHSSGKFKALTSNTIFSTAIAYLGTYLNKRGYRFDYVNSFQEEKDELAQKLAVENIMAIGIITTYYISPLPIIEIMEFIRKYNKTAKIIVGGPFVSTKCRSLEATELEYLFSTTIGADIYVNSSQGEATLLRILESLKNNAPLDKIPNIYFKNEGRYISTLIIKEDNELSKNLVDWNLFADRLGDMVNVRTSISCPFSCAFCGFPERAGKYQALSAEEIGTELNQLAKIGKVKHIKFIDDTFNVPIERFKKILRMIIKDKHTFKWYSNFRCQFADEETVELLKKSGCKAVFLGIESGNNMILKNMNKAATVEKYLNGIRLLNIYGIQVFASFIIGFPGETNKTAQDTLNFINESGIDFYQAQPWYGEPITPIYREKDKYLITGQSFEWRHKTMDSAMASDWVEKIFLSIENAIWVPQHNFSFDTFWNQQDMGISPENLKNFLRSFNEGIKEKIQHPLKKEISFKIIKQLKQYCAIGDEKNEWEEEQIHLRDKQKVEFNF